MKTVVFVTFENEFAPLGGLAAVMRILPKRMAAAWSGPCVTITPFFREIVKCRPRIMGSIQSTGITFSLAFGEDTCAVEVFRHRDAQGFTTYLLDTPEFFNAPCDCGDPPGPKAPCNPYVDPARPSQLLNDSLLFCAAVPKALVELQHTQDLIVCLQDWETACVAMTAKAETRLASVSCLLTLHNSYDRDVTDQDLQVIASRPLHLSGRTVLSKMAAFFDGPVCTVSQHFAHELEHDPVQRTIFVPHLQNMFRTRTLRGIRNGRFSQLDFPQRAGDQAVQDTDVILKEKTRRRREMIEILQDYATPRAWGCVDFTEFTGPVFLFFGRDDPRQKGYDVAAAAIRRIPAGHARYLFTPIPGDEGVEGLGFLKRLAEERNGEVKVFPFRMDRGYRELQRGASFLVMCSFYEPFGGAIEGYAVGTPVVARATGGLVQQIAPCPARSLTGNVETLSRRYHDALAPPTGFLYREPELTAEETENGWKHLLDCEYGPQGDRATGRESIVLFQSMVEQAATALQDAIDLYNTDQTQYATMIMNGFQMLDKFSWDMAVHDYQEIFKTL